MTSRVITQRLFHGGKPGLAPGDLLEPIPHYVEGCDICAAHQQGRDHPIEPRNHEPQRIFVTTDREYARFYASKYPYGDLCTVQIDDSADALVSSLVDPFPTWHVAQARVHSVVSRAVCFTDHERRRLANRWGRVDRQKAWAQLRPAT